MQVTSFGCIYFEELVQIFSFLISSAWKFYWLTAFNDSMSFAAVSENVKETPIIKNGSTTIGPNRLDPRQLVPRQLDPRHLDPVKIEPNKNKNGSKQTVLNPQLKVLSVQPSINPQYFVISQHIKFKEIEKDCIFNVT